MRATARGLLTPQAVNNEQWLPKRRPFAPGPSLLPMSARGYQSEKKTHFDANHRHTVRWDLSALAQTAKDLKAVIRNTLLSDARQDD
jgi:hypothetical protein